MGGTKALSPCLVQSLTISVHPHPVAQAENNLGASFRKRQSSCVLSAIEWEDGVENAQTFAGKTLNRCHPLPFGRERHFPDAGQCLFEFPLLEAESTCCDEQS